VTPGKGGEWVLGKPVFDTVESCQRREWGQRSVIYVPAAFAWTRCTRPSTRDRDDSLQQRGDLLSDMIKCAPGRSQQQPLVGPNCPGMHTPDQASGHHDGHIAAPGNVGLVSR